MASYDAQINILVAGQRNINNLLGQLNQVEDAIGQIESRWRTASAALQRADIRLGATGRQQPRGEGGRFTSDPDRQARLAALADRRRAAVEQRLARMGLSTASAQEASIRNQIEGNDRLLRQTERRISLESQLNTAVERLERRQSAYARGGGGSKLSEELQDRVRNIQTTFQAVGGANVRNLSLVRSLATELGSIVELQNEVNRGTRLQSAGFYKAQGLERGIASLRERGLPPSAFATVGGQMRDYRSAIQKGNQPEAETIAKRIKENLDRLARDLDQSFAELKKSQSVRLAARSWQTFFEDAASQALQIKQSAQNTKESWQVFFKDAANQALAIKQAGQDTKQGWKNFFEDATNQALSIKQNGQETKQAWKSFFEDAANQALAIKQAGQDTKQSWKSFFEDAANQALAIKQGAVETKNAWKLFFEDAASQALQVKQNAKETKNSWQVFFEDAAGEANRLRSPMLQAKQNWQQFFIDAAKEAATARRKPVGAMTPEQRVAGGILDPASLRQQRLGRVARGRKGQEAVGRAASEGLVGGAFPLLFGQGAGASAGGFTGGVLGGLAGGGLGFGLSLLGTVLGTAVDEADRLDKELAKVNASVKGVGNTSADVNKLASSLGIAKEEAINLLAQFKQFGSAQIRKDLALVFGGDRGAILERLESIVKEEDALQAIAAARKEIGNQEAISLLNTFKIQGSAQAQLVLREALLRISEKEVIEEKKRITLQDRLLSMFASGGGGNFVDPGTFGKERAEEQQKAFEKERDQRRKNYDTAIKESQEFFKELDALSPSGKGSKDALGSNLLSAIDSRNEAIDNARKQREQQIADIRKQAIEAAARIEEDLADKRKQIEREIQDVRRSRADSAVDADIRFRELRGEDPGLIEAERELLAISREDRDARIELQRRLGDEEEAQARVITRHEEEVAKQIRDANLAGARAIGEIQSNYAKQVAKIIEEGSDKAGKRLAKAAEMVSLYMQRGTQNNMIGGATGFVIPERTNGAYNFGAQGGRTRQQVKEDPTFQGVPTSIDNLLRIDDKLEQLKKDLNMSRRPDIGQQFTALLGAEGGYEDIAGLEPLPIQKMYQQIGRPFTELYKKIQDDITGLYASQWPGAAATTEARESLGTETLDMLDDKKLQNLQNYFAVINEDGIKTIQNFEKQGKQLDAQLSLMRDGLEPSLAQQLVLQEETYSLAVKELQGRRRLALEAGRNATAVEEFYKTELELLKTNNIEIKRRTVEYARQSEYLLAMASLNQQLAVTGVAEQAGFFGAGASAFTSELSRSGDIGQATDLAERTRAVEAKQAVADIRGELNSLTDSTNIAITAANGVGVAFAQSFQGLIDGSMSAREALGSFFKSVADMFLEMAAQIIAKQITMIILQTILKALGAVSGANSASALGTNPNVAAYSGTGIGDIGIGTFANAKGNAFGASGIMPFANGGAFTNSIVSSPTLFKFANGGAMRTGLMGEAGPEAIMPLKRGSDGRLGVEASGMAVPYRRSGPAPAVPYLKSAGGAASDNMNATIDVKFETVRIGGVDYVTRDEAEKIGRESAQRGADLAHKRYRNNPSSRREAGFS